MQLPKFTARSRVLIIVVLIIILLAGSAYLVFRQKSGADVNQAPINLDVVIKPRVGVFAAACSDPIECQGVSEGAIYFDENPLMSIANYAQEATEGAAESCIESLDENGYAPGNIPPGGQIKIGGCKIKLKKTGEDGDDYIYEAEAELSGSGTSKGDFLSTYEIKAKNKGSEKIQIAYQAKGKFKYDEVYFVKSDSSWRNINGNSVIYFSGSVNAPFEFSMDGSEYLEDYFDSWNKLNPDLQIDRKNSKWKVDTDGRVFGSIKGSWDYDDSPPQKGDIKITALEFCPDDPSTSDKEGCSIQLNETLNLKAKKLGKTDGIAGDININANHNEDYFGNGEWNPKTGQLNWISLIIKREDNRDRNQNLSMGSNNNANYAESVKSKAEEDKVGKKYTAHTETKKDLTYKQMIAAMPGGNQNPITNEAHSNIVEDNNNSNITRSGDGSKYTGSWIKGIYDSEDVLMKITDPQNMAGQRIDPFTGVPEYSVRDYFPAGTIHVPGQFTAGDYQGVTTIASRKVKGVPQYVYVFRSYNTNPPDPVFPPQTLDRIDQLINALDKAGANVQEFVTNNKQAMLSAFSKVRSGSWVINVGHGGPTGLWAGKTDPNNPNDSDDKHLVTDAEINQILKNKQIEIDTFAGLTCFAGRRTSLAQRVIGSLGVASGNETPSMLKIIGLGNQSWTLNLEDIFGEIRSQSGCK